MFVLVTVLDVVEGFFGELPRKDSVRALSRKQIEELGARAMESASVTPTCRWRRPCEPEF